MLKGVWGSQRDLGGPREDLWVLRGVWGVFKREPRGMWGARENLVRGPKGVWGRWERTGGPGGYLGTCLGG